MRKPNYLCYENNQEQDILKHEERR